MSPVVAVAAALMQDNTAFKLHYGGIEPWEYMKQNPRQEELLSRATTAADVLGTDCIAVSCAACSSQAGCSPCVMLQTSLRHLVLGTKTPNDTAVLS